MNLSSVHVIVRFLVLFTVFQCSLPKLTIKLSPAKYSLLVSILSSPPTISPVWLRLFESQSELLILKDSWWYTYTWLSMQSEKTRPLIPRCAWACSEHTIMNQLQTCSKLDVILTFSDNHLSMSIYRSHRNPAEPKALPSTAA